MTTDISCSTLSRARLMEGSKLILCRLCLNSCERSVNIFNPNGTNGLLLWEIIKELLQLDVNEGDGLPRVICHPCLAKLEAFKYFKATCIKSSIECLKLMALTGLVEVVVPELSPLKIPECPLPSPGGRVKAESIQDSEGREEEVPKKSLSSDLGDLGTSFGGGERRNGTIGAGAEAAKLGERGWRGNGETSVATLLAQGDVETERRKASARLADPSNAPEIRLVDGHSLPRELLHQCPHCGRLVETKRGLCVHIKHKHPEEQPGDATEPVSNATPGTEPEVAQRKDDIGANAARWGLVECRVMLTDIFQARKESEGAIPGSVRVSNGHASYARCEGKVIRLNCAREDGGGTCSDLDLFREETSRAHSTERTAFGVEDTAVSLRHGTESLRKSGRAGILDVQGRPEEPRKAVEEIEVSSDSALDDDDDDDAGGGDVTQGRTQDPSRRTACARTHVWPHLILRLKHQVEGAVSDSSDADERSSVSEGGRSEVEVRRCQTGLAHGTEAMAVQPGTSDAAERTAGEVDHPCASCGRDCGSPVWPEGRYECNSCGERRECKGQLRAHISSAHRPERGLFSCPHCGRAFGHVSSLTRHEKHRCKRRRVDCVAQRGVVKRSPTQLRGQSRFADGREIVEVLVESDEEVPQAAAIDLRWCSNQRDQCGTKEGVRNEPRRESLEASPSGISARQSAGLDNGMGRRRTTDAPGCFSCEVCGLAYSSKKNLRRHFRAKHDEGPVVSCSVRRRAFVSQGALRRHTVVHSEAEKRFACSLCGRRYKWRKNLYEHERRRHATGSDRLRPQGPSGTFPFACVPVGVACLSGELPEEHARWH